MYPDPCYIDHLDVTTHIRKFLTTWNYNHATHQLATVEEELCKVVASLWPFLDVHAANWYYQHDLRAFATFMKLGKTFKSLFHFELSKTEEFKKLCFREQ